MNIRRMLAFTRRMLLQFRHDRRTLGFIIAMPLLMMLIFGYTFGGDPSNLKVAVVNLDEPVALPMGSERSFADTVVENLDDDTFDLEVYSSLEEARSDLEDGKIWGIIHFPANFTSNLVLDLPPAGNGSVPSTIGVYLDDSNPNIAGVVMSGVQMAVKDTVTSTLEDMGMEQGTEPVQMNVVNLYASERDIEFIDYFAPGVISFAIMMVTTMITIILFVFERRNGTLQRLLASPATEGEIVTGYALAFACIGVMQSLVIMTAAILIFDITIAGSLLLALLVVVLLAIGHQGLGIMLSSAARNELQAIQFVPLVLFPSVLLAGLFWPVESIPQYLQPVSYLIPLRYGIDAERSIMIRGWGICEIWPQVTVLVLFAVLTLGLSVLILKKRR